MQNSLGQRSPPYPYYAPSSPPWSPFPMISPVSHPGPPPGSFVSAEAGSVANVVPARLLGPSHASFHFPPSGDGGAASDSPGLAMQPAASQAAASPSVSLCESRAWQMQQHHQCIDMEDTIGLDRDILEADVVVFDEGIQDPQPTLSVQESPKQDVNVAETSGREDDNSLLIKLGYEPYIGLQFRSEGEAYEYYKAYAKENGFSIRKSHVERSRVDHSLISRKFVCVKQGFRSLKDKRYEGKVVRHRRVTRVDCRAAMIIKRRSGKWVIHRFHKEHNHDLGEHAKDCEFQSHRKMANSTKSILEALYKTQCIEMEENVGLSQKNLETNMMVPDNSIREPQTTVDMQEYPNGEVQIAEPSREGIAVESPNEVKTAEISGKEENDASHIKLGTEPYVGLQFGSQEEAYEFYNAYAKEKGFSIRKSRIERSRIDHSMISRLYVCTNQGLRSTKDKRYEGKVVRPRQETRLDCRAGMFIKRRSGKWVVERFHREHNHDLVDPAKAEKLRSHRKMTMTTKSMIEALYKCGVGPSKIVELLTGLADGAEDSLGQNGANDTNGSDEAKKFLGNNEVDSDSTMKKDRKNNIRVECYHLLEYLQAMQAVDTGFFYAVEFGENRCMRSIFWVDSKAREAYKKYGDVLVFDTICRTNKYLFPFSCFTGLNHHRQPILFGCGFLADETVESFVWLFETWLRAMSNQLPTSIITNQDKAMKVAIEKVFPETRHRFCMWYIEKDELENLTHIFDMYTDFQSEYKRCIFSSWTSKEFESGWEALLVKYNLKDNKWLNKLYNQRHHWVPLYLQDAFFGGMTTTQRSEGMHSYFDGFLHGGTPFTDFIPQYEQAVKERRELEANEDFITVCTRAALASKNPIEEQAARVYTKNMFTIFQREFVESSGCTARKVGEEGPISRYLVGKYRDKDDKMRIVAFNPTDNSASCSCQMFDSGGMLCRHVLKVFQVVDVFEIPPQYILKRWTMSDRYRYIEPFGDEAGGGLHDVNAANVWTLKEKIKQFIELGEASNERINIAISILQEGMKKVSLIDVPTVVRPPENLDCNSIQGESVDEHSENIWMDLNITVPGPHRVKLKGRPLSSRIKLGMEQAQKKKRTCGTCKETGHYTRTCPKVPVDHLQSPPVLQGPVDQSQTSAILHGPPVHSETSEMLQGPIGQSQTSMMLQEPFGQSQIFAML